MERVKLKERVFVSFNEESEWAVYEVTFNTGSKIFKPVKFQAYRIWKTSGAPAAFSGFRASFSSKADALLGLKDAFKDYQGNVHLETSALKNYCIESMGSVTHNNYHHGENWAVLMLITPITVFIRH